MRPAYRVLADDQDVTAALKDRLVQLRISDERGIKSDTCELVFDDRPPHVALPRTGAELSIEIGYEQERLFPMGRFVVDEVTVESPPARLTISAKAANVSVQTTKSGRANTMKGPRTRSWHEMTLGAIVQTIADEAGYALKVAVELVDQVVEHIDQVVESDLGFLTRLAGAFDAAFKPAGGAVIVVPQAGGKTAAGAGLPVVELRPEALSGWSVTFAERGQYSAVVAQWHDLDGAELKSARSGAATGPAFILRRQYPSEAAAARAAQGRLAALQRGKAKLSLSLPGEPRLAAEGHIQLTGFRGGVGGVWVISRAEHTLDQGGFTTRLEAEAT